MMISVPRKPANTASQRRQPTSSPSSGIDSAVISRGKQANTVCISARPMCWMVTANTQISAVISRDREICKTGFAERNQAWRPVRLAA